VLDQLVSQYAAQLQPEDWEVVILPTGKTSVPRWGCLCQSASDTLYLPHWLRIPTSEKRLQALAAYQQLVHNFPDAKETGTALLQLANTAKTKDALIYLDQVISRFPNQAGEALVEKAEILTPPE